MKVVADLHIHSRFSRAVSQQMTIPVIGQWAKKKGINLVGTSDWTHPIWFRELKANLVEEPDGLYRQKNADHDSPYFILSTELSSIYAQGDQTRRVHYLVFAPNLAVVEKINKALVARGVNLLSDGRPIMGLSVKDVAGIVFEIDPNCLLIPAHIWTPWFSLYGSKSGFDSIEECFGDLSKEIFAVETGLSSDPAMNWRITELENRTIVSNSDAHSPQKLGREATVFELSSLSFENIKKALKNEDNQKVVYTIEFYPEEGKYHYTGHRKCNVVYSPNEARKKGMTCPVCGKPLTGGVMSRVESLASGDIEIDTETDEYGVRWFRAEKTALRAVGSRSRRPYVMLVPLMEIIAEGIGVGAGSKAVMEKYEQMINSLGSEFDILLKTSFADLAKFADAQIVGGIKRVRSGDIVIEPGYDGIFGKVKIWREKEKHPDDAKASQTALF